MRKYWYLLLCFTVIYSYGGSLDNENGLSTITTIINHLNQNETSVDDFVLRVRDLSQKSNVRDTIIVIDNPYLEITFVEDNCDGNEILLCNIKNKIPSNVILTISYDEIVREFHLNANESKSSTCTGTGFVLSFPKKDYNNKLFNIIKFQVK